MAKYKSVKINGKIYLEHRVLMERLLGRKLSRHETVHHKNGDGLDNRIENLELISRHEHSRLHMMSLTKDERIGRFRGARGNAIKGQQATHPKLDKDDVLKIKERLKTCTNFAKLGREFGIGKHHVYLIRDGKRWANV